MFNIKKKILIILWMIGMMLCTACAGKSETESGVAKDGSMKEASNGISPVMEGSIEVLEDLPDRDIKVPEYLKGEIEEKLNEEDYHEENSAREQNDNDSVFHLSGEEQTENARQVAAQIEDSINQVLADKDYYPNIIGISVNPECTEFNVIFSGRELSLYENVLPMSLCIVGDRFQLYQGKQENELLTVVNYIDADSGEIFNTTNSKEIE